MRERIHRELAARWCIEEGSPAPMLSDELMDAKPPASSAATATDLLAVKMAGKERQQKAHIPELEAWMEREDGALHEMAIATVEPAKVSWGALNEVFWSLVS